MKSLMPAAVAVVLMLAVAVAGAFEIVPYSAKALEEARGTDSPVALHFHSKWCATCRQQTKVFRQLRSEPQLDMKLLVVDFDADEATVQDFGATVPGLVIVMRGSVERARMTGVTKPDDLLAGLRKAF